MARFNHVIIFPAPVEYSGPHGSAGRTLHRDSNLGVSRDDRDGDNVGEAA